ncbi:MAG: SbcC/MukB-like Walker B domain-containing protein, partial [Myxococcota bacterium]
VIDPTIDLYDLAFLVFAMAWRYRVSADAEARAARAECLAAEQALDVVARVAAPALVGASVDERRALLDRILADPPDEATLQARERAVAAWDHRRIQLEARLGALGAGADEPDVADDLWAELGARLAAAVDRAEAARDAAADATRRLDELEGKAARHAELTVRAEAVDREQSRLDELTQLLRGDRFVEFVANDHLAELTARASVHLQALTSDRYGLALDQELAFVVRDEDAGGAIRPVHSLSGGESFLTALSLALALSEQVQQRSARPLGFFFLDEGFGTLDPEAIDRVMTAIERLRDGQRLIGLISHVPAIRERVPRYLWVTPPTGAHGSRIELRDA